MDEIYAIFPLFYMTTADVEMYMISVKLFHHIKIKQIQVNEYNNKDLSIKTATYRVSCLSSSVLSYSSDYFRSRWDCGVMTDFTSLPPSSFLFHVFLALPSF